MATNIKCCIHQLRQMWSTDSAHMRRVSAHIFAVTFRWHTSFDGRLMALVIARCLRVRNGGRNWNADDDDDNVCWPKCVDGTLKKRTTCFGGRLARRRDVIWTRSVRTLSQNIWASMPVTSYTWEHAVVQTYAIWVERLSPLCSTDSIETRSITYTYVYALRPSYTHVPMALCLPSSLPPHVHATECLRCRQFAHYSLARTLVAARRRVEAPASRFDSPMHKGANTRTRTHTYTDRIYYTDSYAVASSSEPCVCGCVSHWKGRHKATHSVYVANVSAWRAWMVNEPNSRRLRDGKSGDAWISSEYMRKELSPNCVREMHVIMFAVWELWVHDLSQSGFGNMFFLVFINW